MKNTPKPLQDLDLLDRFLFAEAMEDPVILQYVLEIILNKDIALLGLPQTEKEAREEGRLKGQFEEQRKAIHIFISEFLAEGISADRILAKLQKSYGLTAEQAEGYYQEVVEYRT